MLFPCIHGGHSGSNFTFYLVPLGHDIKHYDKSFQCFAYDTHILKSEPAKSFAWHNCQGALRFHDRNPQSSNPHYSEHTSGQFLLVLGTVSQHFVPVNFKAWSQYHNPSLKSHI